MSRREIAKLERGLDALWGNALAAGEYEQAAIYGRAARAVSAARVERERIIAEAADRR